MEIKILKKTKKPFLNSKLLHICVGKKMQYIYQNIRISRDIKLVFLEKKCWGEKKYQNLCMLQNIY